MGVPALSSDILHIDFETASEVDLKLCGVGVYARHPSTRVMCMAYAFNEEEPDIWINWHYFGKNLVIPVPARVLEHIRKGGRVVAHNAVFEHEIWNKAFQPECPLSWEQMDCTMVRALALGLPAKLEKVAEVLSCPEQKDMKGNSLMLRISGHPEKAHKWKEAQLDALFNYCLQDVRVEQWVDAQLPHLDPFEEEVCQLTYRINSRGVFLDKPFVEACDRIFQSEQQLLHAEMEAITEGAVDRATQRQRLVIWLQSRGHALSSLAKAHEDHIVTVLRNDPLALRAYRIYQDASRSSVAKFAKMLATLNADGRSRFVLQYYGAFTGRWAGRSWQPQNMKRVDEDTEGRLVDEVRPFIFAGDSDALRQRGDVSRLLSLSLRSAICAPEEKMLIGADYTNIEGRLIAWLAGADIKVQAYREQDAGGPDMYKRAYASSFGISIEEVTHLQRQIGKTGELALSYQGSVGAYVSMAASLGVNIDEIASLVMEKASTEEVMKAALAFRQPGANHYGLTPTTWLGLKIAVSAWRNSDLNGPITQFFWDLQDAALEATKNPRTPISVGKTGRCAYYHDGTHLFCRLITGRVLTYTHARHRIREEECEDADGNRYVRRSHTLQYDGWDSVTQRWGAIHLYGGLQANHVTQGTARDIMARGLLNVEKHNFPVILTIHDEAVSEIEKNRVFEDASSVISCYENLLIDVGSEFKGLPLRAKGWCDERYVK